MSAINQSKIGPNNFAFVYGAPEGPRAFVSTTSCARLGSQRPSPRLRPGKNVVTDAKRLLQRYRRKADIRRCVGFSYGRRLRRRPVAQGRAMSEGRTFSPPAIRGFDGSKRSRTSRFLTSERATTKASFRLLACRSATLKKALPK
jgi:hypothetical protein